MSSSHARKRTAAIIAAVPVLVAGGPLVTPAHAAGEYQVENLIADNQVIGPNAGFLGLGIGHSGTTAMFKITPPAASSTLSRVNLALTADSTAQFNFAFELASGDGLAVYADVDGIANGFSAKDKAEGLRSSGFATFAPNGKGDVPISIGLSTPASGAPAYYVTVRPNSTARNLKIRFEVPEGGIGGNAGDGPSASVSTPTGDNRMAIDAAKPNGGLAPGRNLFTVDQKTPGHEDAYFVAPAAATEPDVKVAFFNTSADTGTSALLRRPGYSPALPAEEQVAKVAFGPVLDVSAPTSNNRITVGDGTGIVPNLTTVARNNQLSNAVFARLVDGAGNLSAPAVLTHCFPAPSSSTGCTAPANGNVVTAPLRPDSAAFETASGTVAAINLNNEAAAPVRVKSSANAGADRDRSKTELAQDTTSQAKTTVARVIQLASNGEADNTKAAESSGTWASTADLTVDTRTKIDEGRAIAVAHNVDAQGNVSEARTSVSSIVKDITRPTVTVDLPSGAASGGAGEVVSVQFSEPMTTSAIKELPQVSSNPERCAVETDPPGGTVSHVLIPTDGDATGAPRTWGSGNCFKWAADGASATIRLGADDPATCDANATTPGNDCTPRVGADDKIYFAGTYPSPVLRDANGNQAMGLTPGLSAKPTSGYTKVIAPPSKVVSAETRDANANGVLDAIDVTFTLGMDLSSIQANLKNFSIVGNDVVVPVSSAAYVSPTDPKVVRFSFAGDFGTGVRPFVKLSETAPTFDTGVRAGDDPREVQPFSFQAADKAAPRPKRAVTADVDGNGYIDRVVLTYSEPINHELDYNDTPGVDDSNPIDNGGYRVQLYELYPASSTGAPGRNPVDPKLNFSDTKTIRLKPRSTGQPHDTGTTPTLTFKSTNGTTGVAKAATDAAGNAGGSFEVPVADGTPIRIVARTTRDLDNDGRLDAIDLKMSEIVPAAAVGAQYEVTDRTFSRGHEALGTDGLRLHLNESTTLGVGDTGAKPLVRYIGGMTDSAGNTSPGESTGVASADGAGPAIVGACVSTPKGSNGLCPEDDPANDATGNPDKGAKLAVFFSEVVDATSVAAADLKVEQPAGTDKGTASAAATAASTDNKFSTTTLTFPANTLDYTADVHVRFAAANAVLDNAFPKNGNTQVGAVVGTGYPVVGLTLTCPVTSNAGTCSELTVNMDATGTSGVSLWRLAQTARATVPPAEEFTANRPGTTYTFPTEGRYTLYLSGKDAYGRLSSEVAKPMFILKAPKITAQEFATTTAVPRGTTTWPSTTLLDGDAVKIGANAVGTDAAEWAAKNLATTTGDCYAQHMSIDVRSITGTTLDGAVAPQTCDLLTGTETPTRQMRFPGVVAKGTTKYPVGTVLKISDSDPGFLVVDGPNGTLARRNFISVNARRSWMITDASVIKVSTGVRDALTRLTKDVGYRDGAVLKSSTGFFYVENGVKRPVSTFRLAAWKISTARAYLPTSTELRRIPTGKAIGGTAHAPGTWIKYSDGRVYQVVKDAQGKIVRRKAASLAALRTLVPTGTRSQVYAANSSDSKLPVDLTWLRGYRDGTLLKFSDGTFGVIARGSVRKFSDARTFNTLRFNAANALTANTAAIPRPFGQTFRTGAVIERYALGEVVITVTNKGGASVTAEVPNSDGLFGLGTLDPAPAGWDPTR